MAKKKIFRSKAHRDAWEAHVDETLRRLWDVAMKARAEVEAKKAQDGSA